MLKLQQELMHKYILFSIEIVSHLLHIYFQNKNKQLIERNRELLTHIQQLLNYTNELEKKLNKNGNENFKLLKVFYIDLKINQEIF